MLLRKAATVSTPGLLSSKWERRETGVWQEYEEEEDPELLRTLQDLSEVRESRWQDGRGGEEERRGGV